MDKNTLIEVAEDLRHLRRDWGGKITVEEIRRGMPVLRRLLVENHYGNAWRAAGFEKQPTMKAIDLCANPLPADNIIALAWGAHLRGVWVGPAYITPTRMPQREHVETHFGMSHFLKSPSGFVGQTPFSRQDLIQYIANVRSGVHYSTTMKEVQEVIDKLHKSGGFHGVDDMPPLYQELLAIGQVVGRSDDAERYITRVLR